MNPAYSEIYLGLAAVFRRYEPEFVDVVRERNDDTVRDCFVGKPSPEGKDLREIKLKPKSFSQAQWRYRTLRAQIIAFVRIANSPLQPITR